MLAKWYGISDHRRTSGQPAPEIVAVVVGDLIAQFEVFPRRHGNQRSPGVEAPAADGLGKLEDPAWARRGGIRKHKSLISREMSKTP